MSNGQTPDQGATPGSSNELLTAGIASYFDVVKALHLFQTRVADVCQSTVDTSRDKIVALMKLSQHPGEASRYVYPAFPMDTWDYEECAIGAWVWLDTPQNLTLYLGVSFQTTAGGMQACTLHSAVEVTQQRRRNEWRAHFQDHADLLNEEWDGYAIGLRRPLKSPAHLEKEIVLLWNDFLERLP